MTRPYQTFKSYLVEQLRDPMEAKIFLEGAIETYGKDSDIEVFMISLRYLAEAQGGIPKLAERTQLNRQNLYKILTGKTVPRLDTTLSIIKGLEFRLTPEPITH